ncbi:M-phase phosphoprotein 9 isoform X1 [Bufo bufo]|uniref:M-phase phosphoprotein 9 isoform X1 n=1 Tax=Bufo bufo TaxID=8384 RepID=UPI001ABE767D|nr:M-phase phosphoprotein 9 isoform X1 [Bufo bufo]
MEASNVAVLPQELPEPPDSACIKNQTDRSESSKGANVAESSSQCDDLQTSFLKNLCVNDQTDLEARKSCEARWLQLFQLVERQCQEQLDAQQEKFSHQFQLIREEIKHLAHLQEGSSPWSYVTGNAVLPVTYDTHSLKPQDEQRTQDEERGKNSSNPLHLLRELDIRQRAFITQEHFLENTSISSGYGTHSASEPNACLSSCSQNTSRETRLPAKETLKECRAESHHLKHVPVESEKPFKLLPGAWCHQKSSEGHSSENSESHFNCDKNTTCSSSQPNRSLTTWAQKLKRAPCKKSTKMDQIPAHSAELHSPSDLECTDGSSNTFYLNNRTESVNSLFSGGSGFTYWMMDDKEMYHPLPEHFESGFSKLFTPKEAGEVMIPSLTDIYHQKQRGHGQGSVWEPVSPSEHTHPPEILTLDPTLHRKPSHNAVSSKSQCNESYAAPVTPDSILENPSYNQDDEETASNTSSLLGDSSNRSPQCLTAGDKQWKSTRYKVKKNIDYQLCHGGASSDERMNCTEDEANSLASSPLSQSPLPPADKTPCSSGIYPMDHPVMLSNIRRSLREKHARHLADLRDYYESEISNLKQQLLVSNKSTSTEDLMKINSLTERCAQMEAALTEASKRIHVFENRNSELEIQGAEWKERYYTATGTSKDLQEQIEEMRARSKEKENAISRLQSRLKEVEESLQKTIRQSDDKEARIKQEHKMFQDLLLDYESLVKEHERVKDTLGVTENKLCDALSEVNELRRTASKLETQIKQLEHDNMVKFHHKAEGQLWTSRPKNEMFRTSGNPYGVDVAVHKCLASEAECSAFTGKPLDNKAKEMEREQDLMYGQNRYQSPPEKDAVHDILSSKPKTEDHSSEESPILKALRDYEEEKEMKMWSNFTNRDSAFHRMSSKRHLMGISDCCTPRGSPEKSKERQRQPNSPCGPRSSSLPPSNRKSVSTPTKRELMLMPLSVKHSPKRSPSENLSPGLSQLLHSEENTVTRNQSPRKRLQFMSLEDPEVRQKTIINSENSGESQFPLLLPPFETEITYNERMKTISETERLFDELTEEKKQIEAALSRMPGTGRRLSLKMRATKESLEDRLEKINRELGSVRMTLKKYHVLPTSANI